MIITNNNNKTLNLNNNKLIKLSNTTYKVMNNSSYLLDDLLIIKNNNNLSKIYIVSKNTEEIIKSYTNQKDSKDTFLIDYKDFEEIGLLLKNLKSDDKNIINKIIETFARKICLEHYISNVLECRNISIEEIFNNSTEKFLGMKYKKEIIDKAKKMINEKN